MGNNSHEAQMLVTARMFIRSSPQSISRFGLNNSERKKHRSELNKATAVFELH